MLKLTNELRVEGCLECQEFNSTETIKLNLTKELGTYHLASASDSLFWPSLAGCLTQKHISNHERRNILRGMNMVDNCCNK